MSEVRGEDPRLYSAAAERNQAPILEAIRPWLSQSEGSTTHILEVASGSGQHAAAIAEAFSWVTVQPSDLEYELAESVAAWSQYHRVEERVKPLIQLDACQHHTSWDVQQPDVIYSANMIHISPWDATVGLFQGAAALLSPQGKLILYGPYQFDGVPLAPSNVSFDEQLRSRNSQWGIRTVRALDHLADREGMHRVQTISCPANNHILVYQREGDHLSAM